MPAPDTPSGASRCRSAAAGEEQRPPVHLVVLQHGLWGRPECVSTLGNYLQEHLNRPPRKQQQGDKQDAGDAPPPAPTAEQSAPSLQQQQQHAEVQVLNCEVNRKALTYDGIDVCGARVVQLVLETIQSLQAEGRHVTHLSFIGYSLGGLILRYAVGKLYVLGLFEEVSCANFITIATPHLGSWRVPTGFWSRFFNSNVAIVASRTGRQLMLVDDDYTVPWLSNQQELHDQAHMEHLQQQQQQQQNNDTTNHQQQQQNHKQQRQQQQQAELPPGVKPGQAVPLLLLMAHPSGPFHKALLGFTTRIVAANIKYDAMVPYCTAALCMSNPYEQQQPILVDPRYPSIVRPAAAGEVVNEPLTYKGRTKRLVLFALFSPLAPLLYTWSVAYGWMHHRAASKQALEGSSWLQQHHAGGIRGLNTKKALIKSKSSSSSSHSASSNIKAGGKSVSAAGASGADKGSAATAPSASSEGLITTAVQGPDETELLQQQQQLEGAAAAAAKHPADGGDGNGDDDNAAVAAAAAQCGEGEGGSSNSPSSRRRSSSLAAALQHHTAEDELGRLSRQISSKGVGGSKAGAAAAAAGGDGGRGSKKEAAAGVCPSVDSADLTAAAEEEEAAAAAAAAGTTSTVVVDSPEGRVTVDREGIVEAPGYIHQQQQWMAQQLFDNMPPCKVPDNTIIGTTTTTTGGTTSSSSSKVAAQGAGPGAADSKGSVAEQQQESEAVSAGVVGVGGWHRLDVCTRHWHAHAAIIIRDYRFEDQSRDVFQYLVDHMTL